MSDDLKDLFYKNTGRLIHKWLHYLDIYDHHFAPFRGQPITLLEIGISHGGSLQMWKEYFGTSANIIGVDVEPGCLAFQDERVKVFIGDQEDREFLRSLRNTVGAMDIVIDDGGHRMSQQLTSFEELWPAVAQRGIYLLEDLHTSYWQEYAGSYLGPGTFVEFAKSLIDSINAWHTREQVPVDTYTLSIGGMHIYDSIIVFDKASVTRPTDCVTGVPYFELNADAERLLQGLRLTRPEETG